VGYQSIGKYIGVGCATNYSNAIRFTQTLFKSLGVFSMPNSYQDISGQRVPSLPIWLVKGKDRECISSDTLFANKRVALFALPGAFTPTCSTQHVPRYNELVAELHHSGVDEIYCLSINDPFVMCAWQADEKADQITFLADAAGKFTEQMGMLVDHSDAGLGQRSWRYSMIVKNGVIEKMFIEPQKPGDPFEVSDADTMLAYLNPKSEALKPIALFAREGCPFCASAKKMLDEAKLKYETIYLNDHVTMSAVRAVSGLATVPQVFIGGELIGSSDALAEYLEQKNSIAI